MRWYWWLTIIVVVLIIISIIIYKQSKKKKMSEDMKSFIQRTDAVNYQKLMSFCNSFEKDSDKQLCKKLSINFYDKQTGILLSNMGY